ncbi:3-hydroxyisobutyrate dehydrogenase [Amphibiibacter pelophylacis]|uniref:3-hydroxyisobutyrate dehydrogenase n=1 Tax=Amphibiibacter pelophylacis TaxID=1799477 RepID=A0ACC6P157_9BURK
MDIAFIGLGNMGLPMALNLQKAGHRVRGLDLAPAQVEALVAAGGEAARDIAHAVQGAQAVFTMLPASKHVERVWLGEDGVLAHVAPGTRVADCSTIAPEVARRVAQAAAGQGLALIDAPVSGGTGGAQAGTLTFMVGGDETALTAMRPLLEAMGRNIFHAGPSGCGQTVKICNNMLLGILMIGTSEALNLGIANGMDPKVLSSVMAQSSGRNWALEVYNPCPGVMDSAPAARGYSGGFGVDLMRKDLGLAVENALASGAAVPLGALARSLYDLHSQAGNGALDFSSVFGMLGKKG